MSTSYQSSGSHSTWEINTINIIATKLNCDYSDAASILEAQPFYTAQAWGKAMTEEETANLIIEKSKVS